MSRAYHVLVEFAVILHDAEIAARVALLAGIARMMEGVWSTMYPVVHGHRGVNIDSHPVYA